MLSFDSPIVLIWQSRPLFRLSLVRGLGKHISLEVEQKVASASPRLTSNYVCTFLSQSLAFTFPPTILFQQLNLESFMGASPFAFAMLDDFDSIVYVILSLLYDYLQLDVISECSILWILKADRRVY